MCIETDIGTEKKHIQSSRAENVLHYGKVHAITQFLKKVFDYTIIYATVTNVHLH